MAQYDAKRVKLASFFNIFGWTVKPIWSEVTLPSETKQKVVNSAINPNIRIDSKFLQKILTEFLKRVAANIFETLQWKIR